MARARRRRPGDRDNDGEAPTPVGPLTKRQAVTAARTGGRHAMTPHAVAHLQRTHGNRAVGGLVTQRDWQSAKPVGAGGQATPTVGSHRPDYDTSPDKMNRYQVVWGGATGVRSAKKVHEGAGTLAAGNDPTQRSGIQQAQNSQQAMEAGASALRRGAFAAASASMNLALAPVMGVIGIIKGLVKTIMKFRKALKLRKTVEELGKASKQAKQKLENGDDASASMYAAAKYGMAKVRRNMVETFAKFALGLAKVVANIITFISGGATIMVTGTISLVAGAGKALMQLYHGGKAVYKQLRGTKGVNRKKNATTMVERARVADPEATNLLFKLKAGKAVFLEQQLGRKPSAVEAKRIAMKFKTASKDPTGVKRIRFGQKMLVDFFPDVAAYRSWLQGLKGAELEKVASGVAGQLRSTGKAKDTMFQAAKAVKKM